MVRIVKARRWIVLLATLVAAGALVGAVVAGQRGPQQQQHDIAAAIERSAMIKVADIAGSDGLAARGVYVQELDTGHLCVWDASFAASRSRGGGCNAIDDPFNGRAVSASLSYDGGPGIASVRDARLSGLAAGNVARVAVLMSDGSERMVKLKKASLDSGDFVAFGYRLKKADLKRGIGPTAIVAFDAGEVEIGRQPTGIGG